MARQVQITTVNPQKRERKRGWKKQQRQEKATQYQLESRNILTPEQGSKAANLSCGHGRGPVWKMDSR
jgi:hypothetical protein